MIANRYGKDTDMNRTVVASCGLSAFTRPPPGCPVLFLQALPLQHPSMSAFAPSASQVPCFLLNQLPRSSKLMTYVLITRHVKPVCLSEQVKRQVVCSVRFPCR